MKYNFRHRYGWLSWYFIRIGYVVFLSTASFIYAEAARGEQVAIVLVSVKALPKRLHFLKVIYLSLQLVLEDSSSFLKQMALTEYVGGEQNMPFFILQNTMGGRCFLIS